LRFDNIHALNLAKFEAEKLMTSQIGHA